MMVRLHFLVEGETEETFVNQTLRPHLAENGIYADARMICTQRKRLRELAGGITGYAKFKNDIIRWMKEDNNDESWFTTMIDYYGLPADFPTPGTGHSGGACEAVKKLETSIANDVVHDRFIPYVQLHEFEALLFSDPTKFADEFSAQDKAIENLCDIRKLFESPEEIDDGYETSPSRRIIRVIPQYAGRKATAGPVIATLIGLETLRTCCPHFGSWLAKIEMLVKG